MPQPCSAAFDAALAQPDRLAVERLEVDLPVYRRNLSRYPSPSGGTLGGWVGGPGVAIAQDTTRAYVGRSSLKLTVTNNPGGVAGLTPERVGMTWAGDPVAGSVRLRIDTALSGGFTVYWLFGDAAGNVVSSSTPVAYSGAATGGWITVGAVATVPSGTTQGILVIQFANPPVGTTDTAWVDALLVERSGVLGTYFDGDVDAATNLFTNPTIERDLHDFVAGNAALTIDTAWSPEGVGGHSVGIIPTGASNDTYVALAGNNGSMSHSLAPGRTVTISATVNVPAALTGALGTSAASIVLFTHTGAGYVSQVSARGPVAGGTQRLSLTATIPAGVDAAFVRLYHGGSVGSGLVRWGDIRITDTGDATWRRPRVSWDGTRQASTSRLNTAPYFDLTDALNGASVNRSITTDLPDAVSLVTGSPSASLSVELGGPVRRAEMDETRHAFWLFNPDNTASPLYGLDLTGAAVRYWAGLATGQAMSGDPTDPELLRLFTGSIDSVSTDSRAKTAALSCIDPRGKLRSDVNLPAFAFQRAPGTASTAMNPGLLGSWCLDYLLRASGIHSGPPPRDQCLTYMSGNGSAWPDLMGDDPYQLNPMLVRQDVMGFIDRASGTYPYGYPSDYLDNTMVGTFHTQCVPSPEAYRVPNAGGLTVPMDTGGTMFFEGDVYVASDTPLDEVAVFTPGWGVRTQDNASLWYCFLDITPDQSKATLRVAVMKNNGVVVNKATTISVPTDSWHRWAVQATWASSSTITVTVWLDYAQTPTTQTVTGFPTGYYLGTNTDLAFYGCYVDSVQLTAETSPSPAPLFAPQAYLDPSLNALAATVEVAGDPWGTIQALAEAELGYAGFDELGVFRFRNRNTIAAAAPARRSDAAVDLTSFQTQAQRSSVVTRVKATTAGWRASRNASDVWGASDAIKVARYSTYTDVITLSAPALAPLIELGARTTAAHRVGQTEWRAAKTAAGAGAVTSGITVTAQSLSPLTFQLSIINTNAFDVWLVSPDTQTDVAAGTPFLYVGGALLVPTSSVAQSKWPPFAWTANPAGDVVLELSDNPWRQDLTSLTGLTEDLLAMLYKPRHLWEGVAVIGDPTVQLADRKHVSDADTGLDNDAYVFGSTFDSAAWTSTLNLRAVSEPGGWVLGVPGRSEMGVATRV